MTNLPPPGASSIGKDGSRKQVSADTRPGTRPVGMPAGAREVDPFGPAAGVKTNNVRMYEVDLPGQVNRKHIVSYVSVDGRTLEFMTHDRQGKPLERRETLALWLSIREMTLGGSPQVVMDAFGLSIQDRTGLSVLPIENPEAPAETSGYSLGE